ncbi:AbrB/MazE/SpoVT family DNA-binding domain-containing protein [Thioalkalivibrio paradoxus]|uniref:Programmed cell death antitoxin MazE n=1 Tax=Thioalkalivibrio paradoxus ARh 1 TaxID=713585 RepID=W0DIM4_9GAMM|nr:hypothetical protein [Thioalkalivibrio paradoxus]AHE98271.1 programmed cell death antitoxin MazE [Thioalkalivibrio paradoxus ARh 1]
MSESTKARFEGTVQPWGNSLGIRITRPVSALSNLTRGDRVTIEVTDEGLLVRKASGRRHLRFSEEELVSSLTPHTAHADELPALLDRESGT